MFTRTDFYFFGLGLCLIVAGFILIALDPVEHGFGLATLWVAPPLLLAGFFLPVIGIIGPAWRLQGWSVASVRNITGLITSAVALATYWVTLEPTASLWDCSEFIASAYKLQVPHTPGTPLSLIIGRVFTMLAHDPSGVAYILNFMSGLFSAMTVLVLYHLIYYFAERALAEKTSNRYIPLLSAVSGSLCLAFSDSFWFSAVEAETYGLACFFLVLLIWLIITGKDLPDAGRSRRLVLIFYVAGLGYCIHPMCLLALPVLPVMWYLSEKTATIRNTLTTTAAGLCIVFVINKFIAIGMFELAFSFDKFFVNAMAMPFYSGAVFLVLLMGFCFFLLLRYFQSLNRYTWAFIFLIMGFLPYGVLFLRSNHNPPIDETNPENLAMIKAYMNRESYPSSPLIFGPYFDAQVESVKIKKEIYYKGTDSYEVAGTMPEYEYDKKRSTILPRMYSNDAPDIESYRAWTGLKNGEKPGFYHNVQFMLRYQIGHMYLRYLMFNFVGRESDVQNSNWLKPWDALTTDNGPLKERARNQYWMVPLLLGIIGMIFQYFHDRKHFIAVSLFFLITGAILALYLNSPPGEPRERDYIYVGSYIAFSIWIGLALPGLLDLLPKKRAAIYLPSVIALAVPCWMLYQNYDDHNRSGRTFQVQNARHALQSCAPNSILFTGGDNDTFPLWYLQDVEGFRTDVRVMVLSYFNTDWYINQLRRRYYESAAFNLTLDETDYRQYGPNDVLYVQESIKNPIDVQQYFTLLRQGHPALTMRASNGEPYHILPSRLLAVNTGGREPGQFKTVNDTGTQPQMVLKVNGNYLQKNALAILDVMVSNNGQRPLYFNATSLNDLGLDIEPYLIQEGPVYRLTSERSGGQAIRIDTGKSYENLITKSDYSNLARQDVNFNYEDFQARMVFSVRQNFNSLAIGLIREGETEKAVRVMQYAVDHLYLPHLQPSYSNLQAAEILINLDKKDTARMLSESLFDFYFARVGEQIARGQPVEELDEYLVETAAMVLEGLGYSSPIEKVRNLGLVASP